MHKRFLMIWFSITCEFKLTEHAIYNVIPVALFYVPQGGEYLLYQTHGAVYGG